jgi:predicted membrane-bound mannosyltransferase
MNETEHHIDQRSMFVELRAALARQAMQAYLLLNGAAAVALLAFLGSLATAPSADTRLLADLRLLKISLLAFTTGVALAAATYWVAYTVHTHHIAGEHAQAERYRAGGILVNILALLLFMIGIVVAARAITPR